ncbi:MAG: cytochrome c-type biogenesis protein CcmH [Deltaproteobacteria bacterium]|jgi:cytochrome c-type biogenesis protein CcmH
MRLLAPFLLAAILGPAAAGVCADGKDLTPSRIEQRLSCQCGCGLTVANCDHLQCSFAVPAKKRIIDETAAGKSADTIIRAFVTEYGEKVLSSPTHRGFNLLAWYTPYTALLVATLLLVWTIKRWARPEPATVGHGDTDEYSETDSQELKARLGQELKDLEQ